MTKITLSTGTTYTVEVAADEIKRAIDHNRWIMIEDDSRDIAIRSSHIIAIEEDTAAIIKEAEKAAIPDGPVRCSVCGAQPSQARPLTWENGRYYCPTCYVTR